MADINMVLYDIELLRDKLSSVLQTKDQLLDPEILKASTMLDKALNEYDKLKFKGLGCNQGL